MQRSVLSRMRREDDDILPVYNRPSSSRKPLSDCYVHLVPLIVFFAIFVLWRFSNSEVIVEFKDGVVTVDYDPDIMLDSLDETRVDMAFLAAAKPPYASNVLIQAVANYTAAAPVKWTCEVKDGRVTFPQVSYRYGSCSPGCSCPTKCLNSTTA